MMDTLGIPSIGEDNSRESVVRDLRNAVSSFTDPSTKTIKLHCSAYCFVEELSVFTGYQNTDFLATLTNWYDSRDRWRRGTKHQGRDEIDGVCFNLLAATAPDWLPHILPREAVGGGFTSRVVFIVEERKGKIISDPDAFPIDRRLEEQLKYDLEIIGGHCTGEFGRDAGAKRFYQHWYETEEKLLQSGQHELGNDPYLDGYVSRRPTLLLKLAMLLNVSRSNEMMLSEGDFRRALSLIELAERKMSSVYKGIGRNKYVQETEMIIDFMKTHGKIRHSSILRMLLRQVDELTLNHIMKSLSTMGMIRSERLKSGDYEYTLLDQGQVH